MHGWLLVQVEQQGAWFLEVAQHQFVFSTDIYLLWAVDVQNKKKEDREWGLIWKHPNSIPIGWSVFKTLTVVKGLTLKPTVI